MKLADTTFTTGPKDELAAVDVYGLQDTEVKNNIVSSLADFSSEVVGKVRNEVGAFGKLQDAVDIVTGKITDPKVAADRVVAMFEDGAFDFSNLKESVKNATFDALESAVPQEGTLKYLADGVLHVAKTGDVPNAKELLLSLGEIVGETEALKLVDLGLESAIAEALVDDIIDMGMPELIGYLEKNASDSSVTHSMSRHKIRKAARTGNLDFTMRLLGHVGPKVAMSDNPDLVEVVLESYRYPDTTPIDYDVEYTRLKDFLVLLNPAWADGGRSDIDGWLQPFIRVSDDAMELFVQRASESKYRTQAIIGSHYRDNEMAKLTKTFFPHSVA